MNSHLLLARVATLLLVSSHASSLGGQAVVRLPGRDVVLQREPRTLYSVGAADGAGPDVFGAVGGVGFDAAENLYVLDRLNARVVVFDSTGRVVRAMGRRGGGPGEFGAPQQMAVSGGGEVVVSDVARRALIIFDRDGAARSVPYPGATMLLGRSFTLYPRGGVVSVAMGNPTSGGANAFGEEILLWMPTSSGLPRRLATVSTPASREAQSGGVRVYSPVIFSPSFQFAVLPSGFVAITDEAEYSVRLIDGSGRVQRILRRPIPPRPVTARDRASERERRIRQLSEGGGLRVIGPQSAALPAAAQRTMADQLRDAEFAPVMPVIRRIAVDAMGNLWIERVGPALDGPGSIDLVAPEGRYLGTLRGWEMPAAFSPGGRAAYLREDEMGVQRVVVIRP